MYWLHMPIKIGNQLTYVHTSELVTYFKIDFWISMPVGPEAMPIQFVGLYTCYFKLFSMIVKYQVWFSTNFFPPNSFLSLSQKNMAISPKKTFTPFTLLIHFSYFALKMARLFRRDFPNNKPKRWHYLSFGVTPNKEIPKHKWKNKQSPSFQALSKHPCLFNTRLRQRSLSHMTALISPHKHSLSQSNF